MRPSAPVLARNQALSFAGTLDRADPRVVEATLDAPAHGVLLKLWLAIDAATSMVLTARFQAFGCATSIACASLLAERVEGRSLDEARSIDAQTLSAALELPNEKRYAAELSERLLWTALERWEAKCHG